MSTELEQAKAIAERIAKRVSSESSVSGKRPLRSSSATDVSSELAAMRAGLSELQKRLTQIEAKVRAEERMSSYSARYASETDQPVPRTHSPWLAGVNASISHPSQERFGVEEATVTELVDFFEKEKTCGVEPGGKPCDHCAMCSSRGF